MRKACAALTRYDGWLLIAVEDHGAGTQYVRFGIWPKCSGIVLATIAFLAAVAGAAAMSTAWIGQRG